eukprot:TRINITY_DN4925_c0_g1_i1.p1 TRINITY_DN4925_c0_g1~~TRINITY_DN4925_c0_g1_i1.p1  ORF type:complete len:295 (+),score=76.93 TRINITY_DN4925_c0_g1_i1:53-937(+)
MDSSSAKHGDSEAARREEEEIEDGVEDDGEEAEELEDEEDEDEVDEDEDGDEEDEETDADTEDEEKPEQNASSEKADVKKRSIQKSVATANRPSTTKQGNRTTNRDAKDTASEMEDAPEDENEIENEDEDEDEDEEDDISSDADVSKDNTKGESGNISKRAIGNDSEVGAKAETKDSSAPSVGNKRTRPDRRRKGATRGGMSASDSYLPTLPISRTKRLIRMDPDIKTVSADSYYLITKATEVFLEKLVDTSKSHALKEGRKGIQYRHVDILHGSKSQSKKQRESIVQRLQQQS